MLHTQYLRFYYLFNFYFYPKSIFLLTYSNTLCFHLSLYQILMLFHILISLFIFYYCKNSKSLNLLCISYCWILHNIQDLPCSYLLYSLFYCPSLFLLVSLNISSFHLTHYLILMLFHCLFIYLFFTTSQIEFLYVWEIFCIF